MLLQLAKSAKDVPDTAVLKGDLDQVRTVAEQEEPEYEPRADTIRGGAGIVRALSKVRTKRQVDEVKRIHEERMQPIGEGEEFEWDGLRRRKTVSSLGDSTIVRRKTIHPPLGMTHFPDDISEPDSEVHPGFFGRIGRKSVTTDGVPSRRRSGHSPVPLSTVGPNKSTDDMELGPHEHVYGLPSSLAKPPPEEHEEDTSYRGASTSESPHIRFVSDGAQDGTDRSASRGSSLAPPRPPPHAHGNRRQFSFTNVFHRRRDDEHAESAEEARPTSGGGRSFVSRHSNNREYPTVADTTEEERLGLVQGDSSKSLPKYSELPDDESDEWQVTSGNSSSPEQVGTGLVGGDLGRRRTRDPYQDMDDEDLSEVPLHSAISRDDRGGRGGGGSAFV